MLAHVSPEGAFAVGRRCGKRNAPGARQQPAGPTLHRAYGAGMHPRRVLKLYAISFVVAALSAAVAFAAPQSQAPTQAPVEPRTGVSFVRDVLPVLSKAGCNAGGCHAKPEGQNGFKLS